MTDMELSNQPAFLKAKPRCVAVRMHSKDGKVPQLRHDLQNGPTHVFGGHSSCNPFFCKHRQQNSECPPPNDEVTGDTTDQVEISQESCH